MLGFILASLLAQYAPPCPVEVLRITSLGLSPVLDVSNDSEYPVDDVRFIVTVEDGLGQPHQLTDRYPVVIQPRQKLRIQLAPITDFVANFQTLDASATCAIVQSAGG
jgi:hypothetical protein